MPKGVQFNMLEVNNGGSFDPIVFKPILQYGGIIRQKPIASSDASATDRQGPDAKLAVNFPMVDQIGLIKETFNLYDEIYKDQNSKSNIYYYLPKQFTLKWTQETNEYAFNVYYMSGDDNSRGSVLLNVELTPNIKKEDIELAEKMLSKEMRKNITLMPLDLRDVPKVDFGGLMARFNINQESVSTSIPSDYQQPIVLDWRMDSNIDNFVGAMLNQKVGAMMNFQPYGDSTSLIT